MKQFCYTGSKEPRWGGEFPKGAWTVSPVFSSFDTVHIFRMNIITKESANRGQRCTFCTYLIYCQVRDSLNVSTWHVKIKDNNRIIPPRQRLRTSKLWSSLHLFFYRKMETLHHTLPPSEHTGCKITDSPASNKTTMNIILRSDVQG